MKREEVYNEVCKIIAEHFRIGTNSLQPNNEFVKDLNADSVDIVTLMFLLEDRFDINIEYNRGLFSISDTVDLVFSKLADGR